MLVKITNIKKRIYGIFILSGEVGNKKTNSNNAKNIIVLTTWTFDKFLFFKFYAPFKILSLRYMLYIYI